MQKNRNQTCDPCWAFLGLEVSFTFRSPAPTNFNTLCWCRNNGSLEIQTLGSVKPRFEIYELLLWLCLALRVFIRSGFPKMAIRTCKRTIAWLVALNERPRLSWFLSPQVSIARLSKGIPSLWDRILDIFLVVSTSWTWAPKMTSERETKPVIFALHDD